MRSVYRNSLGTPLSFRESLISLKQWELFAIQVRFPDVSQGSTLQSRPFFFFLLATLHRMWHLISLTRDQTVKHRALTTGQPGKSQAGLSKDNLS